MKKILTLLQIFNFNLSNTIPNIPLKSIIEKNLKNYINLSIKPIIQENDYYCIPACIQMIFRYLNVNINQYSQHRIFQDLNGTTKGIIANERINNYLNSSIWSYKTNYCYNYIFSGFDTSFENQLVFQNYVYNSLLTNHPLIFGYYTNYQNLGHALIISGIIVNWENPNLTKYIYINPSSANYNYFNGENLYNLFILSSHLIGNNFIFEINKIIKINNSCY